MSAWSDFEFDWQDPAAAGGGEGAAAAEEEGEETMPNWGDNDASTDNNDTNDTQQQQHQQQHQVVEGTSELEQQHNNDGGAASYQQEEAQAPPAATAPVHETLNPSSLAPAGVKMEEENAYHPTTPFNNNDNNNIDDTTETNTNSGVDGIGMWKSWTHNYEQPRFACLDLLDNCFDATLQPPSNDDDTTSPTNTSSWTGKVAMQYLAPNGMIIRNNSAKAIKPLAETLTAYRSEKNSDNTNSKSEFGEESSSNKQAIGEYGVGLKQACATLSTTSFVLTRNHTVFELGVIAEDLQTRNSVSLPHFQFRMTTSALEEYASRREMAGHIAKILKHNPKVAHLVTSELGRGNRREAIQTLVAQYHTMWLSEEWKSHDHVFQLIITDLIHTKSEAARTSVGIANHPARGFLQEIRALLPKHYINVPQGFAFDIEEERVNFSYWQNRLVEMTKFEVNVPKEKPVQNMPDDLGWEREGYDLSIYCGFDALRVEDKAGNQAKTCQLCIYSRQSGRLIEITQDARDMLGMASSGVDFSQGLTVIVVDEGGELPLKPTKDGLTWSKEASGEIHRSNLMAWIGAVGYQYWKSHFNKFDKHFSDSKKKLSDAVLSFVKAIEKRIQEQDLIVKNRNELEQNSEQKLERLGKARFTMFGDVPWKMTESNNSRKVKIRSKKINIPTWPGPATLFKFNDAHYSPGGAAGAATASNNNKMHKPKAGKPRAKATKAIKKRKHSLVGLPFGAPVPEQPRARKQVATQQASEDSSSGSEEEEVVVERHIPGRRVARKKTEHVGPSVSTVTHGNNNLEDNHDTIRVVETLGEGDGDETAATKPHEDGHTRNDSARVNELEREVRRSHDHIRKLQQCVRKLLLDAKNKALSGENAQQQQSPQATARMQHEISQLQQQKNQLERNLQQAKEEGQHEAARLQLEVQRLQLQLQHQQNSFSMVAQQQQQQPQPGMHNNGGNWGVPYHYGSYDLC